jgi:hypothetical protein
MREALAEIPENVQVVCSFAYNAAAAGLLESAVLASYNGLSDNKTRY